MEHIYIVVVVLRMPAVDTLLLDNSLGNDAYATRIRKSLFHMALQKSESSAVAPRPFTATAARRWPLALSDGKMVLGRRSRSNTAVLASRSTQFESISHEQT
jgi:hypothetical protein